jgi:hypothetical protein
MRKPPITFYVMSAAELEELAAVAARHPLVGGKRVAEKIRGGLRRAATQYTGDSDYLVTVMAYLGDNDLLEEADVAAGRISSFTWADDLPSIGPILTSVRVSLPRVSLRLRFRRTGRASSTRARTQGTRSTPRLNRLHEGLTMVGDDAFLVIHW